MSENAFNKTEKIPLCVILARKDIDSPWSEHIWQPVSVVLDPPRGVHGKIRQEGDGWTHYFLESDPLELYREDAPAYRETLLQQGGGSLWVVLNEETNGEDGLPYSVHLVTASPFEAQDYLDSGEILVEVVDMPEGLRAMIESFVAQCPPEEEFIKRKQKKKFSEEHTFGQQPFHEIRELKKTRH